MRRSERLSEVIAAVERAMQAHTMSVALSPAERLEGFGGFRPEDHEADDHEAEVERRWGGGERYEQSRRRVAACTKADWVRLKAEAAAVVEDLAAYFRSAIAANARR